MLDEADRRPQPHWLGEEGVVTFRFGVEPVVERASSYLESMGGFRYGNNPQ